MSDQIDRYNYPTTIYSGAGARHKIPDILKDAGKSHPLIVTDRGIASLPICAEMRRIVSDAGMMNDTYSDIFGNPTKHQVVGGVNAYRKYDCDSIIAFGGGAAIDVAKAIAVMINHPGDLFDYEDTSRGKPITKEIPFTVSVPTTAGTGSEAGRSAVVSDDDTKRKKIIFAPSLMAKVVFLDPEFTTDLPASITATTGMDALTHLVEAYLAKGEQPLCDGIALEGMRRLAIHLPKCVEFAKKGNKKTKEHIESRRQMLNAAMMGAVAFQKGLGVTHSCAHALSTVVDMHHGLANGILIPYCMKFNAAGMNDRFKTMAMAVGLKSTTPAAFIKWLEALKKKIGIPKNLKDVGVKKEHLARLVEIAVDDVCHPSNPKPVTKKDFEKIFRAAIG